MSQLDPIALRRARDHLRRRPWHAVTTADIAEAVGVSRMTLHRRGLTKEAVLAELGELLEAEHRDAAFAALTAPGSARERLACALEGVCEVDERYLGLLDAIQGELAAVFHERGDGPVLTRAEFTDALRRLLEDGAADGSLAAVADPAETATLLFNAAGWTYRHMRTGHRWPPERARRAVVDLLIDGVRA